MLVLSYSLYIFKHTELKRLHFRKAYTKGENFDEVHTATELSAFDRRKYLYVWVSKAGKS